jgi:hypothetical protein
MLALSGCETHRFVIDNKMHDMRYILTLLFFINVSGAMSQVTMRPNAPGVPEELSGKDVDRYSVSGSVSNTALLLTNKSSYTIHVGPYATNKIQLETREQHDRERLRGLDYAGGIWNLLVRRGGDFESSRYRIKGRRNTLSEFAILRKKEVAGRVVSVIQHSYDGQVRERKTPSSASNVYQDYTDTLLVISQIEVVIGQPPWLMEVLLSNVAEFKGTLRGEQEFEIAFVQSTAGASRTFIFHKNNVAVAAFVVSFNSHSLLLSKALTDNERTALVCATAALQNAMDIARTSPAN